MAYTPVRLSQVQPGITETTLYTVPAGKKVILKQIHACNTSASDASFSLSLVASGETAGNTNRLFSNVKVPANGALTADFSQVMNAGDFLSGLQSVSGAITLTISGIEVG